MCSQYCEQCKKETEHREVMRQKPSKYDKSRKGQFLAFLDGFFSGPAATVPGGASLEVTDRYVICSVCGKETLENHGEEFQ